MRLLALTLLLVACAPEDITPNDDTDDTDDTDAPTGDNPDPDVNSYIPAGYRPENPQRLIFLGDSITRGDGASPSSQKYASLLESNLDSAWPDHGDHDLETLFPSIEEVLDLSKGGATTKTMVNSQLPSLNNQINGSADGETIVVMTIGGNDMQAAIPAVLFGGDAKADEAIEEMVGHFNTIADFFDDSERFPDGVYVYLGNVYEPTDGEGYWQSCFVGLDISSTMDNLDDANQAIRDFAEDRGVAMIDMAGHFKGHGFYHDDAQNPYFEEGDQTLWFANDCIHPNNRGHHEIRRLFFDTIDGIPLQLE
jgi:lysophospholipase L1-like esterase